MINPNLNLPFLTRGGFGLSVLDGGNVELPPSVPLMRRFQTPEQLKELMDLQKKIDRGETIDFNSLAGQLMGTMDALQRNINTGITAFPVRENLEAEAKILVPVETPVRNRLPRVPGSGTAAAWRQITALGGGWGSGTNQPGGGSAAQVFFSETGAPAELTTTYASKSSGYKLMGALGSVTGFAMAAGANFQNQYATEKRNALMNMMLNEENALINGASTSTAAPWGDGTNALAFDGLINLITTANGCPSANITTSAGALSFAMLDAMLLAQFYQGARRPYFLFNPAQTQSLRNLVGGGTAPYRVVIENDRNKVNAGVFVNGYVHPITGEIVPVETSKFLPAGTILLCAEELPDGQPAAEVDVLPQVQLPELAPNDMIQGYVAQDLAPAASSPQVFKFLVSCYEVLKLKGATVFCKATGVS